MTKLPTITDDQWAESSILQQPVFSRLKGVDKRQKALILNSDTNLSTINQNNKEGNYCFDVSMLNQSRSKLFQLYKSESIESYLTSSETNNFFDEQRKDRARRTIIKKLRSLESLNLNSFDCCCIAHL